MGWWRKLVFLLVGTTLPLWGEGPYVYGHLLRDGFLGQWHDSSYWGIDSPIPDREEWLAARAPGLPFYPPFNDARVRLTVPFVYPWGALHHGVDYARPDGQTFPVLAAADGRVIWSGYHPRTGNVLILEHVSPKGTRFRTFYHHLRGGAERDRVFASKTRLVRVPPDWAEEAATLQREGDRGSPRFGSADQVIEVEVGERVRAGQRLGWAGRTGLCLGQGNRVHFKLAQEGEVQGWGRQWIFLDPYGEYTGKQGQRHPSFFAPLFQDFVSVEPDLFEKARLYFSPMGYFPTVLTVAEESPHLFPQQDKQWSVSGSFQPDGRLPTFSLRLTLAELQNELAEKKREGWRPDQIVPSAKEGQEVRYTVCFVRAGTTPHEVHLKMAVRQFLQEQERKSRLRWWLHGFYPYREKGELWVAAIWLKPTSYQPQQIVVDLDEEALKSKDWLQQRQGLFLHQLFKVRDSSGAGYAALWQPKFAMDELAAAFPVKEGNLMTTRDRFAKEGFVMASLSFYRGEYAALFRRSKALEVADVGLPNVRTLAQSPIPHGVVWGESKQSPSQSLLAKPIVRFEDLKPFLGPTLVEGEDLVPMATASSGQVVRQNMQGFGPRWTGNSQLLWMGASPDSTLDLLVNAPESGEYVVSVSYTQAPQYGRFQVTLKGAALGPMLDGFAPQLEVTPKVTLGRVTLQEGQNRFRLVHGGKNPHAAGHMVGLNFIELSVPVAP